MDIVSKLEALNQENQALKADNIARKRLQSLFDQGSFTELDAYVCASKDLAGVVTGYGTVDGNCVFAFSQDSTVKGGAVGRAHAAKIQKVYDLAFKTGAPIVGVYDSLGGALLEGNDMLEAYGKMLQKATELSGVVPQVSVVAGPCTGMSAMVACMADFVVMSGKGELAVENQQAEGENAVKEGAAHIVCEDDEQAFQKVRELLSYMPLNNLEPVPVAEFMAPACQLNAVCENLDSMETENIVACVFDANSVLELQKGYGDNAFVALASLSGQTCGVVATRHGKTLGRQESIKMARMMNLCDAFGIPVVTFVDTKGFESKCHGAIRSFARLAHIYAQATCPKVAVVLGDAFGSAYVALAGKGANADITFAWPSAVISALNPVTAVSILHNDQIRADHTREQAAQEYAAGEASAFAAAKSGQIDDVIEPDATREKIIGALDMLYGKRVQTLPKKHGNLPL